MSSRTAAQPSSRATVRTGPIWLTAFLALLLLIFMVGSGSGSSSDTPIREKRSDAPSELVTGVPKSRHQSSPTIKLPTDPPMMATILSRGPTSSAPGVVSGNNEGTGFDGDAFDDVDDEREGQAPPSAPHPASPSSVPASTTVAMKPSATSVDPRPSLDGTVPVARHDGGATTVPTSLVPMAPSEAVVASTAAPDGDDEAIGMFVVSSESDDEEGEEEDGFDLGSNPGDFANASSSHSLPRVASPSVDLAKQFAGEERGADAEDGVGARAETVVGSAAGTPRAPSMHGPKADVNPLDATRRFFLSDSRVGPRFPHWQITTDRFLGVTRQDAMENPLLCGDVLDMLALEDAYDAAVAADGKAFPVGKEAAGDNNGSNGTASDSNYSTLTNADWPFLSNDGPTDSAAARNAASRARARSQWRTARYSCEWYHFEAYPLRSYDVLAGTPVFPFPQPSTLNVRGTYEVVARHRERQGHRTPPSAHDVHREANKPVMLGHARMQYVAAMLSNSFTLQSTLQMSGGVDRGALHRKYGALGKTDKAIIAAVGPKNVPYFGVSPFHQARLSLGATIARLESDVAAAVAWNAAKAAAAASEATTRDDGQRVPSSTPLAVVATQLQGLSSPPPLPTVVGPSVARMVMRAAAATEEEDESGGEGDANEESSAVNPRVSTLSPVMSSVPSASAFASPASQRLYFSPRQHSVMRAMLSRTFVGPISSPSAHRVSLGSAVTTPYVLIEPHRSEWIGLGTTAASRFLRVLARISPRDVRLEAEWHFNQSLKREGKGKGEASGHEAQRYAPSSLPLRTPTPEELLTLSPSSPMLLHLLGNSAFVYHHDRREGALAGYGAAKEGLTAAAWSREGMGNVWPDVVPRGRRLAEEGGRAAQLEALFDALMALNATIVPNTNNVSAAAVRTYSVGGAAFPPLSHTNASLAASDPFLPEKVLPMLISRQTANNYLNLWTHTELIFLASTIASSTNTDESFRPSPQLMAAPKAALRTFPVLDVLHAERAMRNMFSRYRTIASTVERVRLSELLRRSQEGGEDNGGKAAGAVGSGTGAAVPVANTSSRVTSFLTKGKQQHNAEDAEAALLREYSTPAGFPSRLPPHLVRLTTMAQLNAVIRNRLVRLSPSATPFFEKVLVESMESLRDRPLVTSANGSSPVVVESDYVSPNAGSDGVSASADVNISSAVPHPSSPLLGVLSHAPADVRASHVDAVAGHWNMSDLPSWLEVPTTVNVANCLDPLNQRLPSSPEDAHENDESDQKATTKKRRSAKTRLRYELGDDLFQPKNSILILGASHGRNLFSSICSQYVHARELQGRAAHRRPSAPIYRATDLDNICSERGKPTPGVPERHRFSAITREQLIATFPHDDPYVTSNAPPLPPHNNDTRLFSGKSVGGPAPPTASAAQAARTEGAPIPLAYFMQPYGHLIDVEYVAAFILERLEEAETMRARRLGLTNASTTPHHSSAATDTIVAPDPSGGNASTSAPSSSFTDEDTMRDLSAGLPHFVGRATGATSTMPSTAVADDGDGDTAAAPAAGPTASTNRRPFGYSEFFLKTKPGALDRLKGLFTHVIFVPGVWEATYLDATVSEHTEGIAMAIDLIEEVFRPTAKIILYNIHSHQFPIVNDPTGTSAQTLEAVRPQFGGYEVNQSGKGHFVPPARSQSDGGESPFDVEALTRVPQLCAHSHRLARYRDAQLAAVDPVTRQRVRDAWRGVLERAVAAEASAVAGATEASSTLSPLGSAKKSPLVQFVDTLSSGGGSVGSPPPRRVPVEVADLMPATSQSLAHLFADGSGHHYQDVVLEGMSQRVLRDYICPPRFVLAVHDDDGGGKQGADAESGNKGQRPTPSSTSDDDLPTSGDVLDEHHAYSVRSGSSTTRPYNRNYAGSPLPATFPEALRFTATTANVTSSSSSPHQQQQKRRRATFVRVRSTADAAHAMPTLSTTVVESTTTRATATTTAATPVIYNLFPMQKLPIRGVANGLRRALFDHPYADLERGERAVERRRGLFPEALEHAVLASLATAGADTALTADPFYSTDLFDGVEDRVGRQRKLNASREMFNLLSQKRGNKGGNGPATAVLSASASSSSFVADATVPLVPSSLTTLDPYNPFITTPLCACLRAKRLVPQGLDNAILRRSGGAFLGEAREGFGGDNLTVVGRAMASVRRYVAEKEKEAEQEGASSTAANGGGEEADGIVASHFPLTHPTTPLLSIRTYAAPRFDNDPRYLLRMLADKEAVCTIATVDAKELRWQEVTRRRYMQGFSSADANGGGGGDGDQPPPFPELEESGVCQEFRKKNFPCALSVAEEMRRRINTYAWVAARAKTI